MVSRKPQGAKGFIVKVLVSAFALLLLFVICLLIAQHLAKDNGIDRGEEITVDESKLDETKEDGFDIMEYDEYLALDRTVIFSDNSMGVSYSIDDTNYWGFGEDVELIYKVIEALILGDSEMYNELVHEDAGHYNSFTQQQVYDISISREERANVNTSKGSYIEYIVKVEYKIHENNGSFRRDIESDASRPQYFVINGSTGQLLVMDIVPVKYTN